MGLFSSKAKTSSTSDTTSNSTSSSTATPIVPGQIQDPIFGLYGQLGQLTGQGGGNDLLNQAGQTAAGLTGSPWNFDSAADLTRGSLLTGGPASASSGSIGSTDKFMNPYLQNVVNSSLADYDVSGQRSLEGLALRTAGGNTGSNAAVADALTRGELARGRGSLESSLLMQGQDRAFGLADQQANRDQQANLLNAQLNAQYQQQEAAQKLAAGAQLGNLSSLFDANQRANAGFQGDLGTLLGNQDVDYLSKLAGIAGTLPGQMFVGQDTTGTQSGTQHQTGTGTQTSSPSLLGAAGSIAGIAGLFSDRRLKRDIERVGTRPDGLGVYLFRYLWSPILHLGVMAQEVLGVKPEAVIVHPSGFLMVDYAQLEA